MKQCFIFPSHWINVPIEGKTERVHCLFGIRTPARSVGAASSNSTTSLVSADLRSIEYTSWGNSAVLSAVGLLPSAKLTASINLANVLILVTVAPVKSLPVVVSLTDKSIDEINPVALLIIILGLGNCPFWKAKPDACIGNLR